MLWTCLSISPICNSALALSFQSASLFAPAHLPSTHRWPRLALRSSWCTLDLKTCVMVFCSFLLFVCVLGLSFHVRTGKGVVQFAEYLIMSDPSMQKCDAVNAGIFGFSFADLKCAGSWSHKDSVFIILGSTSAATDCSFGRHFL